MSTIRAGTETYQVSSTFKGHVQRSLGDHKISDQERQFLATQAQTDPERSFLENHVHIDANGFAEFTPTELSFPNQAPDSSGAVASAEQGALRSDTAIALQQFSAENPIQPRQIIDFQSQIDALRTTDPEQAESLQNVLYEKVDQSVRNAAQQFDIALSSYVQDSPAGMDAIDFANMDQRRNELEGLIAYQEGSSPFQDEHPGAIRPETKRLTLGVLERAQSIGNGNLNAPAATEVSTGTAEPNGSVPRASSFAVGGGISVSQTFTQDTSGRSSSRSQASIGIAAAGAREIDSHGTEVFAYGDVSFRLEEHSGVTPPGTIDRDQFVAQVGVGVRNDDASVSIGYDTEEGIVFSAEVMADEANRLGIVASENFTGVRLRRSFSGGGIIG